MKTASPAMIALLNSGRDFYRADLYTINLHTAKNTGTRIQGYSGTTALKYYASVGAGVNGVTYLVKVTIQNVGLTTVRVDVNFGTNPHVDIAPGTTQQVSLSGVGNGVAFVQLRFNSLNITDAIDFVAINPIICKATDGINLLTSNGIALDFSTGWNVISGSAFILTQGQETPLSVLRYTSWNKPLTIGQFPLIRNLDFEESVLLPVPGWTSTGGATLAYDTSTQFGGRQSLVVTAPLSGYATSTRYPVTPNQILTVVAQVKSDGTHGAYVLCVFFNSSGAQVGTPTIGSTTSSTWTSVIGNTTVPATAITVSIYLGNGGFSGSMTAEFDNVNAYYLSANKFLDGPPTFVRGSITTKIGVDVSNMTLTANARSIDLVNGLPFLTYVIQKGFSDCIIKVESCFMATPGDVSAGTIIDFLGTIGDCNSAGRSQVTLNCNSIVALLQQPTPPRTLTPACSYTLFDTGCALARLSFKVNGIVLAGSTVNSLVTGLTQADGYFDQGVVEFTSGLNAGQKVCVRFYSGHVLTMTASLPNVPAIGDTFDVYPGCDKTNSTCLNKFNNSANFGGQPFVPQPQAVL
jgi:uncharacterized phage protein (TIGR02218 family)